MSGVQVQMSRSAKCGDEIVDVQQLVDDDIPSQYRIAVSRVDAVDSECPDPSCLSCRVGAQLRVEICTHSLCLSFSLLLSLSCLITHYLLSRV